MTFGCDVVVYISPHFSICLSVSIFLYVILYTSSLVSNVLNLLQFHIKSVYLRWTVYDIYHCVYDITFILSSYVLPTCVSLFFCLMHVSVGLSALKSLFQST